jgi:hypothetical protein
MSFRLRPSHPIGWELRGLVRLEFRRAIDGLSSDHRSLSAVFAARKSLKKIRAVVRLVARDLGSHYAIESGLVRRAGHRLAALRDADAAIDTLAVLRAEYPKRLSQAATRRVERTLRAHMRAVAGRSDRGLSLAQHELERARDSLLADLRHVGGFSTARKGLTDGYRRARRAMHGLDETATSARFHLWRRRVKDHWYHVRLFEARSARAKARAGRLRRLETQLGDSHNLAMLRAMILASPNRFATAQWRTDALACMARSDARLRRLALKLGADLFAAKPRLFRGEVRRWRR